jgi:class 3 adenylate cyclase
MNFIINKNKKNTIFLWLLLVISFCQVKGNLIISDESGIPVIQKFSFPNSCLSSGRFSIYEDSSGIFLIGANNKVIIFYGNEFSKCQLNGRINITSNGRSVFFTGYNILGLIKTYRNSPPQFIPIIDDRIQNKFGFGQINDLYVADQNLLFSNGKKLYQFDGSDFSVIDSSIIQIQIFKVADSILVYKYEKGVCIFKHGKLELIKNGARLANYIVEKIIPFNGSLIVKCNNISSFFLLNNNQFKKLAFGFEDFLKKSEFTDAIGLGESGIAIGTKKGGLILFNLKGNTIRNITVKEGLLDNTVNSLHVDRNGNLWTFHDIGLTRIELNVPVSTYGPYVGITGKVNDIFKLYDKLYLATSNGLLVSDYKNIANTKNFNQLFFTPIEDIESECLKLLFIENNLYVITRNGIYLINKTSGNLVLSTDIKGFRKSTFADSLFYIGNDKGLQTLIFKKDKFFFHDSMILKGNSIIEIAIENDKNLWLKTASGELIYFNPWNNKQVLSFNSKLPGISQNLNDLSLLQTNEGARFILPGQIYFYDKSKNAFFVDTTLRPGKLKGISWLYPIVNDSFGNRWCHFVNDMDNVRGIIMMPHNGGSPLFFNTASLISPVISDKNHVWLGGYSNLIQFNYIKKYNDLDKSFVIIKRIIIGKDSILKLELVEPDISHSFNSIRFEVSFTNFEIQPYVRYQYKLEGYDKHWSNWTDVSFIQYSKLKAGNYIFKVHALSVTGVVSENTEFGFYVQHPFYFTLPAYLIYLLIFCFAILVFFRWRMWVFLKNKEKLEKIVQIRTQEILTEKDKSEQLLANILPKGTADELKSTGKATSQKFSMVTVLFSDIQGFTKIAEQMNPENLIDQLDSFFFHFDMVVEKYNIEKIKTIGDAYMCAGGIPKKNITNPVEVVLAALEVQEYMHDLKSKNADIWDLRIGIHTGSVIAGVVGHKKLSYDIWGDTVNTASRMESSGEPGKINISGHTYELVKDFFICEHRGKMPVKYKGEIDMYFVKGIRPELSVNMKNIPNKKFMLQLQLLRLRDIEEEVLENMVKKLPANMYFHNQKNLIDIYNVVELLGRAENLNDEEMLLLKTAALLQDTGYIWSYDEHENYSISYTKEILSEYKYSGEQVEKICKLIDVTRNNRKPINLVEEVMLDAVMHYLGRADYLTLSENLYRELDERGKIHSTEEWIKMQTELLNSYHYYTKTAKILCDVNSDQQIQNILENAKK